MKTIFVSSTFKDMHFERDAIQKVTLPLLKSEATKYGESVSFCDLRWGINTGDLDSEEGSRKVLDVCLDEIDRCRPPMVVILGDRYGWIPEEKLMADAADRKHMDKDQLKREMELEDLQISVTALEIAYGALSTSEKRSQALFYFRHIEPQCPGDYAVEDLEHKNKLDHLKARIEALTNGRIKHYTVRWDGEKLTGVESFAEMVAENIKEVLLPEWKKKEHLTPFERERLTQWSLIEEKNTMFLARGALVQRYYDDLTKNGKHFLAIKAPSGAGKSMLFSNLALKLRDAGYDVVPFMCGLTTESNDSVDILRNTVFYLEELLGFAHEMSGEKQWDVDYAGMDEGQKKAKTVNRLFERFLGLCTECKQAGKRVVIMVDAVDQLTPDENRDGLVFLPPQLSEHVKFVMTCLPEFQIIGRKLTTLQPINHEEKRQVINGILDAHHKGIEDAVIDKMVEMRASDNPLYLSLLIQRLLMMDYEDFSVINSRKDDGMTAITEHQIDVIGNCPDSLQEMSAALLMEAGKRINDGLVRKVAEYLAVSRHGLRREDLAALVAERWSSLDFAHFVAYMDESFIRRDDGRFDFSHKCIREGFLSLCQKPELIHKQLSNYLRRLPPEDSLKKQEIVYHCIQADDKNYFLQYIEECIEENEQMEFAAKDVFAQSMEDDGSWICSVLGIARKSASICRFINRVFIDGSPHQLCISQKILKANIMYAEENSDVFGSAVVSTAYNQYAYVCDELGGEKNLALCLEFYNKSLCAIDKAEQEFPQLDFREARAARCSNYGHVLSRFGGNENYNQAIRFFNQAVALREALFEEDPSDYQKALNLAASYESAGGLLSEFVAGDNQEIARDYLEKAVEIKRNLRDKMPSEQYAASMIGSYLLLARLYHKTASFIAQKDSAKAIECYNQAMILTESQTTLRNNAENCATRMSIALSRGNLYLEKEKGAYNPQWAKDSYTKVLQVFEAMEPDYISDRMRNSYASALNGLGLIILQAQEKAQYEQAIVWFQKSIAILEMLLERERTTDSQLQLLTVYSNCALQYSRMQNRECLLLGMDCCVQALHLAKNIEESGNIPVDYHRRCSILYSRVADLLLKQGRVVESIRWSCYGVKSAVGEYSFGVSNESIDNVRRYHNVKRSNIRDKDALMGGVALELLSLCLAFASYIFIAIDAAEEYLLNYVVCVLLSGFAALAGLVANIPRALKGRAFWKHLIPVLLGLAALVSLIVSLLLSRG